MMLPPLAGVTHRQCSGLRNQKGALQVGIERCIEILLACLEPGCRGRDTGVVYENIDPAHPGDRIGHRLLNGGRVCNIEPDRHRRAACNRDLGRDALAIRQTPGGNGNRGPRL